MRGESADGVCVRLSRRVCASEQQASEVLRVAGRPGHPHPLPRKQRPDSLAEFTRRAHSQAFGADDGQSDDSQFIQSVDVDLGEGGATLGVPGGLGRCHSQPSWNVLSVTNLSA